MDSPEAIANKGYETFGEHFFNAGKEKGVEQEREKMVNFLRSKGVSEEILSEALALK